MICVKMLTLRQLSEKQEKSSLKKEYPMPIKSRGSKLSHMDDWKVEKKETCCKALRSCLIPIICQSVTQ